MWEVFVKNKIKVVELFAGVGGFRLGLENNIGSFETVWANQWEPSTKNQFAFDCYKKKFITGINEFSNTNIFDVELDNIPSHDLLVGGFPCQDYSVAQTGAKGIEGKKGVLFWAIYKIIKSKNPRYVLLENVDRLLKSPVKSRGRDFGIILKSLDMLGYDVEWRVINAAEYGEPQRRRRIFIFASKRSNNFYFNKSFIDLLNFEGFFAPIFPILEVQEITESLELQKYNDLVSVTENFTFEFQNTGLCINGVISTVKTIPVELTSEQLKNQKLRHMLHEVSSDDFNLTDKQIIKNQELKGAKKINRVKPNGDPYVYSEGSMKEYESYDLPARTMLTSEGSINRSSHFVKDPLTSIPRKITPEEAEAINTFPRGWTNTGMTNRQRYFCMGNALVVNLVKKMGSRIKEIEK